MAKSIHKLPEAEIDDLVATAIIDEHRQTRRPVRTNLVCIAVNAAAAADQQAVLWSLTRLKRVGRIKCEQPSGTWLPVAGAECPLSTGSVPTPPPTRDGRVGDATVMAAPSVSPKRRDPVPLVAYPVEVHEGVHKGFANAKKVMDRVGKASQPLLCIQEHIDPGFSAALLDRCAAMNMALMVDARRRYDAGNTDAASELSWLMETGRLLRDAGGSA